MGHGGYGWCIAGICWGLCVGMAMGSGLALHVSPQGRETWSGKSAVPNAAKTDGPLATLKGARDELRRMRNSGALPAGPVTVNVHHGRYEQSAPLALEAEDSGVVGASPGIHALPQEKMGLYAGPERMAWPVAHTVNAGCGNLEDKP